jgi:hypothetical protein
VLQVLLSKCRSCLAWRCAAGAAVQVQELSGVEEGAAGAAVQVQELSGVEEGAAGAAVQVQELLQVAVQQLLSLAGAAGCCPAAVQAWSVLQVLRRAAVQHGGSCQLGENRAAHALGRQGMGQKIKRDGSGFSGCSDD